LFILGEEIANSGPAWLQLSLEYQQLRFLPLYAIELLPIVVASPSAMENLYRVFCPG
jgi:hypothetical protein